ncbi:tRNA 2-selenouridine(34) synthase MnmH [Candidatus Woesearchaeota archaeon]|jgi:tRNA 2-selenouridine synthase|nr:tRNA 2-selenouridine(34) synthase MnmH [Candidatus Woesearchaeota archaeon]MBT5397549.1 tRNA 2-selenouridine(34) synthase MnmH [Candidatus Woesearchaeota archaeon]MBT5924174.1 tRNA 2-selenouridine(34) synthase MnmH [Candidatus Woesearchaeota archaeon]MBT6367878.1 tRNA 2-selenouridine(34) synthase MnmH [Candidatus Woesearchaeota archaeon]MBT7763103.1 tRNA 2-selenouridine(34) synthase MnmH [Candidatus Woesearchaeota archaeon]
MVPKVTIEQSLKNGRYVFIDTRTPKEFEEDHIPNAINIPILSNEERAVVGTLYKQVSQEKAIEKGKEFFASKLPEFMKEIDKHKNNELIIYCWRGGMRSRAVVALLESLKYNVQQLVGGYKSYRKYVRESLHNYNFKPQLIMLWGLTCTGKTQLLHKLTNSLDLEGLAQHRGSLYGAIGLTPRTQKRFETLLLQRLDELNTETYVFVEGESRRIGDLMIPEFLWKKMMAGIHVLITRSIPIRASEAVKEYFSSDDAITKIQEITTKLPRILGEKRKQDVVDLIDAKEFEKAATILLEEYYDMLYAHTLKKQQYQFEVNNDDLEKAVEELKELKEIIHSKLS